MAREDVGNINAVGNPTVRDMSNYGGNDGRGPIDNVLPTGIVARGNEVSSRDGYDRGVRRDMSTTRNQSKARGMSDRR